MKKIVVLSSILLLSFSCSERKVSSPTKKADSVAPTKAGEPPPPKNQESESKEYKVVAMQAGAEKATFKIIPNPGFKINVDFPWKFKFNEKQVTPLNSENIKLDEKSANITLPLINPATGPLEGIGNFSVCNDEKCLIYRDETLQIKK